MNFFHLGGGSAAAFAFLQVEAPNAAQVISNVGNAPTATAAKQMFAAGILSLLVQLLMKFGTKLIDKIGEKKAAAAALVTTSATPQP